MKTSLCGGPLARSLARHGAFLFLLLAAAFGCDRLTPESTRHRGDTFLRHDGDRPPRGGVATDSTGGPVVIPSDGLFVTVVAYPDGYDWRRDTARGDIRGQLLLLRLRDGAAAFDTVLALEAGAGRPVSLDPDRHQFIGGHLYTQSVSEAGTVYRRDGRTVFLSQEREYLRGILALDEHLYTLAQRLDGAGGFVLRRNWNPVLTREGGRIHGSFGEPSFGPGGALFADGGEPCFFYEKEGEWLLVRDGKEESVTLPNRITQLYDIRCFDGVTCLACRWKKREPVLYVGSKKYDLSTTLMVSAQKSGFRLLRADKGIRVSGSIRLNYNQRLYTALWSEKSMLKTLEGRCDWLPDATGTEMLAYVRKEDGRVTTAGVGQTLYTIENGGTLMMPQCACLTGDRLYLALTGPSHPILWVNGQSIPLPLNGFPTSVTLIGNPPN